MKKVMILTLIFILSFSCYKETPPGNTAPPRDMQIYQDRMPQPSNYYSPSSSGSDYSSGSNHRSSGTGNYQNLGCDILKHMKVCVFYNSNLSQLISSWEITEKNIIEFQTKDKDLVKKQIYTEGFLPYKNQIQDIDDILSSSIEEKVMQTLLQSRTRVIDKKMVLRQIADENQLVDLRDAEIKAIRDMIDLLVEINFIPSQSSPDGYEIRIKAVRTKDASILAYRTTSDIDQYTRTRYSFKATENGYGLQPMALEDLAEILMNDVMRDICMNW